MDQQGSRKEGEDVADAGAARTERNARRLFAACAIAFVVSTVTTIAAVVHNNALAAYAIGMDTTRLYSYTAGAGVILVLLWLAVWRVRPPLAGVVCAFAIAIAAILCVGQHGARACQRPLWGSASYDAAIKEVSDTFWEEQKLSPACVAAAKLDDLTTRDSGASAGNLRAAIEACDVLTKRFEEDAAFLGNWSGTSRAILRAHGLSEGRVEWYAEAWERLNKVAELIQDDIRFAAEFQNKKGVLQARLAAAAKGEAMP